MNRYVIFLLGALSSCGGKPAQPGDFSKFLPEVGKIIAPICTQENNGARYILTGVFKLPDSSTISDGKVDLDFYQKLDKDGKGEGRSLSVTVKTPGDINDIWSTAEDVKGKGFRTEEGTIAESALVIHTKNGDAKAGDLLQVTVQLDTITQFQSKEITACTISFVEAEKK
jgi:hypothetical protein